MKRAIVPNDSQVLQRQLKKLIHHLRWWIWGPCGPLSHRKSRQKSRLKKKLQLNFSTRKRRDGILRWITKVLRKMCSTTWHNFFWAKSKKIYHRFFASQLQTVLKNTKHVTKNLIFWHNMLNACVDFLSHLGIFHDG